MEARAFSMAASRALFLEAEASSMAASLALSSEAEAIWEYGMFNGSKAQIANNGVTYICTMSSLF